MAKLAKRLEIRLDSGQLSRLTELARRLRRSTSDLAREAIEEKLRRLSIEERLAAVESMGRLQLPVSDWEEMEREIEAGAG